MSAERNIERPIGYYLPKGYIATNKPLNKFEIDKIANSFYPNLNKDEIECIQEQWMNLCCTITGMNIEETIIGLPFKTFPRRLSESEKTRQSEQSKRINELKKPSNSLAETTNDTENWQNKFDQYNVYNTVDPPNEQLKPIKWKGNIPISQIQIPVGPFISVTAYNEGIIGNKSKGILPYEKRGNVDFDQQYNCSILRLCVKTTDGFKFYPITNRISFFINEQHGKKIFPSNIESQISLILYRVNNKFHGIEGKKLLPEAVRKVFPRLIKTSILELFSTKNEIDTTRVDDSLRIYLLLHQLCIKFMIKYPNIYNHIYRSVMQFVSQPIKYIKNWSDIEELLVAAYLVNIPWNVLRESYIVCLMKQFINSTENMNNSASSVDKIRHIFNQNKTKIHRILLIWSFQGTNSRSISELDKCYSRCWGTLPKFERENMKSNIQLTKN